MIIYPQAVRNQHFKAYLHFFNPSQIKVAVSFKGANRYPVFSSFHAYIYAFLPLYQYGSSSGQGTSTA